MRRAEDGDDHFYPGPCDIAWDVAGAGVELGLSAANRRGLASLYARAANDASHTNALATRLAEHDR